MSTLNIIWSAINSLILILLPIIAKIWADRKLEKLKSALSKEQFIHKLQFEKEFNLYVEIWKHLHHFRTETADIISTLKNKPDIISTLKKNKGKPRKGSIFPRKFVKIVEKITEVIEYHKPFFAEEVYEKSLNFAKESAVLIVHSLFTEKEKKINDLEILKLDKFDSIIDDIEKAIRKRIRNIGESKLIE